VTPSRRRLAILLVLAACGLVSAPVGSEPHDDDAERARRAVREGRFVPLSTILDWLETRYEGRAIEVELEDDEGKAIYEVEWLTPQGAVVEIEFDAHTGELLEVEGTGLEKARRQ
jgi:uncharacterized membrane protein YkoI